MQTAERAAARRCHNNGNTTMKDLVFAFLKAYPLMDFS